ncbi:MAG: GNAT family N-acetyltransferase [Hyphomicrobiaceae bacterium]
MITTPAASFSQDTGSVAIMRLNALASWPDRTAELDPIFFEASLTKSFPDDAARLAFRERWLGRFLATWPDLAHVAVAANGSLLGYIVGAHVDPASDPRFADLGFYRHLASLTPAYPAHLHINLAPAARNQGVGGRLIAAFLADVSVARLPGAHLVTGRDSRNRSFYARNGFAPVAELVWGGTPIVMLARHVS